MWSLCICTGLLSTADCTGCNISPRAKKKKHNYLTQTSKETWNLIRELLLHYSSPPHVFPTSLFGSSFSEKNISWGHIKYLAAPQHILHWDPERLDFTGCPFSSKSKYQTCIPHSRIFFQNWLFKGGGFFYYLLYRNFFPSRSVLKLCTPEVG